MQHFRSILLFASMGVVLCSCTFNNNANKQVLNGMLNSFGYGLNSALHFADTLPLSVEEAEHPGKYYAWWDADKKTVNVQEAYKQYQAGKFRRWQARRFAQVNNLDAVQFWFYLPVKNTYSNLLSADIAAYINNGIITGYYLNPQNEWVLMDSVSTHTHASKKKHPEIFFTDTFSLAPQQTKAFLFKFEKTITPHIIGGFVVTPHTLFGKLKTKELDKEIYFCFGLICFALVFILLLYFTLKENIYLYQSLYIFFSLWVVAEKFGYDETWLPEWLFTPLSYLSPFSISLFAGLFITLVFIEIVQPQKTIPKWKQLFKWLIRINYAVIALAMIHFLLLLLSEKKQMEAVNIWLSVPVFVFLLLFFWVMTAAAVYCMTSASNKQKVYLLGITVAMVLWYIQLLNQMGLANTSFILHNNIFLTLLIEIGVYSYFIIDRFITEKREKIALLNTQLTLQQQLTSSIVEAQEKERKRVAQELHDGLGGFLSALRMMVNKKKNLFEEMGAVAPYEVLNEVQSKLDNAIQDVREISHNLMPSDFETKDFSNILKEHITYVNENGSIIFEYYIDEQVNQCNKSLQISLYRITLELMRNVVKHAQATKATIQIIVHSDNIQLQVEDNGIGINTNKHNGIGMGSIKSRVQYHHGKMTIDSGKLGTTIIIEIPVSS